MGIFARVLEEILIAHQDTDYSYLGGATARGDPVWHPLRRLAIAPEVISRLKQAAESDDRRATLNPDDLEYAMEQLRFTPQERARLRVALLAQGVEIFMRDRMTDEQEPIAAEIAETVYSSVLQRYEPIYERVRAVPVPTGGYLTLEDVLALADRASGLIQAASAAGARNDGTQARFWRQLAAAAYEEIAQLTRPLEPELADEYDRLTNQLRSG
jgi:hypothetical protein